MFHSLKSQNFDAIKPHKYTVSCGDPVFFSAGIKIPTSLKRRKFANIIILLKSQNFDGFLGFFVGSENPSVLSVHGFSGSAKTPKRRKIMTFY